MSRFQIVSMLLLTLLACDRAPSREEIVRRLVTQRLAPDMRALTERAEDLTLAARDLKPGADLTPVRKAWREAMLAWERVSVLRLGPIVDNSGLLRARFWPVRTTALAARVHNPPALAPMQVDEVGVDLRGMYALEWLLFVDHQTLTAESEQGALARAATYAFAANAQRYADDGLAKLRDGAGLADRLVERSQETVSKIVNQLVASIETLATDYVAIVLEVDGQGNVRSGEVHGAASGSSRELVLTQLRTAEGIYRSPDGNGLTALVAPVAPKIDARMRAAFDTALRAVIAIDGPLEQVVVRDREKVEEALRALKDLAVALKVDLASALGVTLTFTAGDGD